MNPTIPTSTPALTSKKESKKKNPQTKENEVKWNCEKTFHLIKSKQVRGFNDENKRITRAQKREKLEAVNPYQELFYIIRRFFPGLLSSLSQVNDPRHQSYVLYNSQTILFLRILAAVFHIDSMRKISQDFNSSNSIQNFNHALSIDTLTELPHWSTINNFLEVLNPMDLDTVIHTLVTHLLRSHTFDNSRIRGTYWQILLDATEFFNSHHRHCPHCLTREHKDKQGNLIWTEYYHSVLEAKLVLNGNIVVSLGSVFIENLNPNPSKQDCELSAFYRLAQKLKRFFPRLPICICADSLYACAPVFDLCKLYNWRFIIRFKAGSIPSVAQEFLALKSIEPSQNFSISLDGITKSYSFVTQISYQTHALNVVEYTQTDLHYPFVFLTDLPISRRNCEQLVFHGRTRWKIENEGFNTQKNHGYGLEHMFSRNETAMKNHYLLIQIGHMIAQVFENLLQIWKSVKVPCYMIFQALKQSFQTVVLSEELMRLRSRQYLFP